MSLDLYCTVHLFNQNVTNVPKTQKEAATPGIELGTDVPNYKEKSGGTGN